MSIKNSQNLAFYPQSADSVSNLSGFGFNGYDTDGSAKWDKITNVRPHKTECSSSLKVLTENWNIGTALWLRRYVKTFVSFC